jgi:GH25 family lysozyme M1 (1,4-beta-N-acetylmuramidase)
MMKFDSTSVTLLQRAINLVGKDSIAVDGSYGPQTEHGLMDALKACGKVFAKPLSNADIVTYTTIINAYLDAFVNNSVPRVFDLKNPFDALIGRYIKEGKKLGIDVSRCQSSINWKLVAKQNPHLSYAITKATDGPRGVDDQFRFNAKEIIDVGYRLGVYSVISPDQPAEQQAKLALKTMDSCGVSPQFFLIDFETTYKHDLVTVANTVHEYESIVNAHYASAKDPPVVLIYTYPGYIYAFKGLFADDEFALATYSGQPSPARCQIATERTWLYQFSGWNSTTLPWTTSGQQIEDRGNGIRIQARPGQWIPIDHDVMLSDMLVKNVFD